LSNVLTAWYLDETGTWKSTTNSTLMKIEEMLQRIQTWKGEKPYDADDGVDYEAVFNKQEFLIPQLETISQDYLSYFNSITFTDITTDKNTITINVSIILLTGNTLTRSIPISA
jgi:hypothetical protein